MTATASSTSVVVPDREIASTRSYARPVGNSEAGKASVSPRPAGLAGRRVRRRDVERRAAADDAHALAVRGAATSPAVEPAPPRARRRAGSRSPARLRSYRVTLCRKRSDINELPARFADRLARCVRRTGSGCIVERLSEDGSVAVGDLAGRARRVGRDRPPRPRAAWRSSACSTAPTAARSPTASSTSCRCATAAPGTRSRRRGSRRAAAARVPDGSAIGMTGGTTTTEVARALADRDRLTVVTNSLSIASELAVRPEPEAGRDRRRRPGRVLRAGRPAGRERAREPEPRPGRWSASTGSTSMPG